MFPTIIFALAFFVRIYNIGLFPINHDEAHWARYLLKNPHLIKKIFLIPITVFPPTIRNLLSSLIPQDKTITLQEFIYHQRFIPVLIGSLTVLMVYILAKEMYGRRTALVSSLLLCFLPWHIIQSRIMVQVIWVPLYGCLIFFAFYKSLEARNKISTGIWFTLTLIFLINSLSTYESALIYLPALLILLLLLKTDFIPQLPAKALVFIISGLLCVLFILLKKDELWVNIQRYYENGIFSGNLVFNLLYNFKHNFGLVIQQLFSPGKLTLFSTGARSMPRY